MQSIWSIKQPDPETVNLLVENLNINRIIARVLVNRGIDTPEKAREFLEPNINKLKNPFILGDMHKAVKRIKKAIKLGENILIYGDYDVDGITSSAVMVRELRKKGARVDYYIPNRLKEGYGLNEKAVRQAITKGYDLIITVDCGIASHKEVKIAQEAGTDVIVTDHHEPQGELPEALAVINPKKKGEKYPFKELAGVGVAFKLIQALFYEGKWSEDLKETLALTAIGTIADIMPLIDENRVIVKNGLYYVLNTDSIGLKTLLDKTGLLNIEEINTGHIGFIIAPRLNATGRIDSAEEAVKLFLTQDISEVSDIVETLEKLNTERQNMEENILISAEKFIENMDLTKEKVIVLQSEEWHEGVIGIVASKITEKFNRPTILFALKDAIGKGSGRSIPPFNLFENLCKCEDELDNFGGHELAAGLTIKKDRIQEFREKINREADKSLKSKDLIPRIAADAVLSVKDVSLELAESLERLKPFGPGNPNPIFVFNNIKMDKSLWMGKQKNHVKIFSDDLEAVGFGMERYKNKLNTAQRLSVLAGVEINEWNGQTKSQLKIRDLKFPEKALDLIREECAEEVLACVVHNPLYNQELDNGIELIDRRGCENRFSYIKNILDPEKTQCILVNSPEQGWDLYNKLLERDIKWVSFYNLNKHLNITDECSTTILIDPTAKQGYEMDEIIFYDTSFSLELFKKQLTNFKFKKIHLVFNKKVYKDNMNYLNKIIPNRMFLRYVYRFLRSSKQKVIKQVELMNLLKQKTAVPLITIRKGLKILEEIKILQRKGDSNFVFAPTNSRIDLNKSKTYREMVSKLNNYNKLNNKMFEKNINIKSLT